MPNYVPTPLSVILMYNAEHKHRDSDDGKRVGISEVEWPSSPANANSYRIAACPRIPELLLFEIAKGIRKRCLSAMKTESQVTAVPTDMQLQMAAWM